MAAKLKVFVTSDGLTDYIVATTSRPKALAAWGVHQDLFKAGQAREADDAALVEAASASPGVVVERPSASTLKALKTTPKKPAKTAPSKAAVRQVKDLEARLAALEEAHASRLGEIEAERAELEVRAAREAQSFQTERDRLSARLEKARAALG